MPNGPSFITHRSQRGERSENLADATADDFHSGPQPLGIARRFQANNEGLIGDDISSVPTTLDNVKISHSAIVRSGGVGKASPHGSPISSDETAFVPAWAVGDPR